MGGSILLFLILGIIFMVITPLVLKDYLKDLSETDYAKSVAICWMIILGGLLIMCIPFVPLLFL